MTIRKYTVKVEESVLVDLKNRLKNTRLHESIDGSNFEYGFNSATLKKVLDHWSSKYDWRKFERELNKYPQFVTQIEGLDVHFFHVKPSKAAKEVKPLLLAHGWPGSAADFLQLIPDLTQNEDLAFELVIPCIPGFGWSEQSHKPGLNIIHIARIFAKLMSRLGHEHFVFHGDDWGSHIGKALGVLYPKRPIGVHVTLPTSKITLYTLLKIVLGSILPSAVYENPSVDVDKVYPLSEKLWVLLRETGYFHMQASKPDTIGAALIDSPAGLAAYLLDRVAVFTDVQNVHKPDGGLFQKFTLDQLCNFVTTTWVTNSITSSMRLYKESFSYHVQVELNFERFVFTFEFQFRNFSLFASVHRHKDTVSTFLLCPLLHFSLSTSSSSLSFTGWPSTSILLKESPCHQRKPFDFQKPSWLKCITMSLSTLIYLEVVILLQWKNHTFSHQVLGHSYRQSKSSDSTKFTLPHSVP